jgi:hypothetical protein
MRTTQRAIFRKCTKKDSLILLRFAGVKRRHAFYRSYRLNCDTHRYFLLTIPSILNRSSFAVAMKKEYEKPVILERYSNPSVADCIINKRV